MRHTEFYYAWKIYIKNIRHDGYYSALLTDLPMKFDCILRNLIIAKLHAQDFNMKSLKLINSYLIIDTKNKNITNTVYENLQNLAVHKDQF